MDQRSMAAEAKPEKRDADAEATAEGGLSRLDLPGASDLDEDDVVGSGAAQPEDERG